MLNPGSDTSAAISYPTLYTPAPTEPTVPRFPPPKILPQKIPHYGKQDPPQRTQGLGDDLRRHADEDNNRDMKDGDKVGSHLVSNAGRKS